MRRPERVLRPLQGFWFPVGMLVCCAGGAATATAVIARPVLWVWQALAAAWTIMFIIASRLLRRASERADRQVVPELQRQVFRKHMVLLSRLCLPLLEHDQLNLAEAEQIACQLAKTSMMLHDIMDGRR